MGIQEFRAREDSYADYGEVLNYSKEMDQGVQSITFTSDLKKKKPGRPALKIIE